MKIEKEYSHYAIIDGKEYFLKTSKNKAKKYFAKETIYITCEHCYRLFGTFENDKLLTEEFLINVKEHEENCVHKPGNCICFSCIHYKIDREVDPNGMWETKRCDKKNSMFNHKSKDCVDYKKNF
jgi:hypothetical protein